MFKQAFPAIVFNGWHFFTTRRSRRQPVRHHTQTRLTATTHTPGASDGILPLVFGTFVSSLIALVLAVPSPSAAIFLVERLPLRLQGGLGVFIELLAGIPSALFGLWGIYTLGPLSAYRYKWIAALDIPLAARRHWSGGRGAARSRLISSWWRPSRDHPDHRPRSPGSWSAGPDLWRRGCRPPSVSTPSEASGR